MYNEYELFAFAPWREFTAPILTVTGTPTSLAELPPGAQALVSGLCRDGVDPAVVDRLAELGFLPGDPVEVVQRGPGGREPLAVRVGETMFALRLVEARCVLIEPHAEPNQEAT